MTWIVCWRFFPTKSNEMNLLGNVELGAVIINNRAANWGFTVRIRIDKQKWIFCLSRRHSYESICAYIVDLSILGARIAILTITEKFPSEIHVQEMSRFEQLYSNFKVIELCGNECSLCDASFDTALIATKCGHLFCVPCLRESMCGQKSRKPPVKPVCPICEASIEKSGQSRQRLKLKIKRLAKVSQMEKEKLLKMLKMYRSLKCEEKRRKPIRISISSDSDEPQDDRSSP